MARSRCAITNEQEEEFQDWLFAAIDIAGGQRRLAQELNTSQGHIYYWIKRGRVPHKKYREAIQEYVERQMKIRKTPLGTI